MSFSALIVSLPLLWNCALAIPLAAGPGYFPGNVSSPVNDVHTAAAAYSLIETYDASNWLSKFDVQAVRDRYAYEVIR